MTTYRLDASIRLHAPLDEVFDFFSRAENLQILTPPWLDFRVETPTPLEMGEDARIDYRLKVRGIPIRWRSRIVAWDPPRRFADLQETGPYRLWHHVHEFEPVDDGTLCRDRVTYAVPGGAIVHRLFVRRDVRTIFDYRHRALAGRFGSPDEPRVTIGTVA
ncbi:MAG: SRPBCC family protein [Gemmatimonadota bacterium]|nr:SRPBCC family protein [Gemmatimonadota bacterium]